jgi:hypothetical protein
MSTHEVTLFPAMQKGLLSTDQCIHETLHTTIYLGFFSKRERVVSTIFMSLKFL